MPEELSVGYYLENFEFLLTFVHDNHNQLLNGAEKQYADDFFRLSEDARKLYVRLTNRRGTLFRIDKLHYAELGNVESAVMELSEKSFIDATPTPTTESVLGLFTKDELFTLPQLEGAKKSLKRESIEAILNTETELHIERLLQARLIEVLGLGQLQVFKLLFFGNFHQDMTEFVLGELVTPFEKYEISTDSGLFSSRVVVDQLVMLRQYSDHSHELLESTSANDHQAIMALISALPIRSTDPLLARKFDSIINRLARQLERLGREADALEAYRLSKTPPSRERQARLHLKRGEYEHARSICGEILEDPSNEDEADFAKGFRSRILKKHYPSSANDAALELGSAGIVDIPESLVAVRRTNDRVELCALEYYNAQGCDAFYVENSLMRSLFGLAFWDIIFASVQGAFINPFQRAPADIFTPDFIDRRSAAIDSRMDELLIPERFEQIIYECFKNKYGTANNFVDWPGIDVSLLDHVVHCIPVKHLSAVFSRLLVDLKNNGSGFPDLIVFYNSRYELIEIKGPGDRLQKNQKRWFQFFLDNQIPARVVNVEYLS